MGFWGHCSDECLKFRDLEQSAIDSQEGDFLDGSNFCIDCRHFRDCPWSSNLLNLVGSLDKDSSARKTVHLLYSRSKISNQSLGNWKPRPEKNQCGTASNAFFIVGGEDAKIGDLPFMALLGYDSPTSCTELIYACGGALINKHYVVTAAHCITDSPSPIRDIVLGDHDVISDPDCTDKACAPKVQRFKAANVIVHEKWDRRKFTEGNDIALIRLDKPAILANEDSERSFLIPVCLPWKSSDPGRELSAGDTTVVAGWGQLTNNITSARNNYCSLRAASRTLQKLNLPISSFEECNAAYRLFEVNNTQQLCSGGEPQKDSCNADSGGPLIYKANEFFRDAHVSSWNSLIRRSKSSAPGIFVFLIFLAISTSKGNPLGKSRIKATHVPPKKFDPLRTVKEFFILPNTYYDQPNHRHPYYDSSGTGRLLYGYGGQDLYKYSVYLPIEGYYR
ncbi:unnamed protein product [Lepeophtheirus salmonis]|uniref:(salmon louse) hypothetical protein n=1 Tax=Lepeophtheirus salmonis TaxID=72036 RepID=A0A7R8H5A9_LEPSM|nr:unnamed protein product [Lepeophtheirus salmonis]CAF2875114.1 unnamed protein product [Lepeophtheirus salmonis]